MTPNEPAAGVQDAGLRALLTESWEETMRMDPLFATSVGDHRYDALMPAAGPDAVLARRAARDGWLARARALQPRSRQDALTLRLFVEDLETDAATDVCEAHTWMVSARSTPVVTVNNLAELMPVETMDQARSYAARLHASREHVQGVIAGLRLGIATGRTPARESVERMITQARDALAVPRPQRPFLAPLTRFREGMPSTDPDRRLVDAMAAGAEDSVHSDWVGWLRFLEEELLPAARPTEREGTLHLPDGQACYQALARRETSLDRTAAEHHRVGLDALRDIHAEMRVLGQKLFGTDDLPTLLARLREDPALRFTTGPEIQAKAEEALARANAAVPRFFGRLPRAGCEVKPIPDYEAPYTYIAYYNPVVPGVRGGEYRINLYAPETRNRFEAEVLAWHESVPGHHFQIAIQQELPEMPAFRRYLGTTAFVEGWALYTERLADEMGLYSGDLDRMGMLSFDTWRASRLVVDTGLHAMGWTREQAVQFMLANTALAENNIRNEVDRYVTWPGQALAYKTGQIEMWALRREAERRLGPRFDLPAFHDMILGQGAVTLPVLRDQVEAWIVARGG